LHLPLIHVVRSVDCYRYFGRRSINNHDVAAVFGQGQW